MTSFNPTLYRLIGEKIKRRRVDLKLSQDELSRKTTVGRTSISNIEMGRHQAPIHILYEIALALETEIHFLLPTAQEVKDAADQSDYAQIFKHVNNNLTEQERRDFELIFNEL